jgi:GTP cyclohydrolase IA
MHRMLPFHVIAHHRLSPRGGDHRADKLGRAMELFERDLQIQERLTVQIAGWLQAELEPRCVGVVLEAWP